MLFGSAEQAADRLGDALAAGATRWYFQIVPTPDDALLETIASEVIPRIQS